MKKYMKKWFMVIALLLCISLSFPTNLVSGSVLAEEEEENVSYPMLQIKQFQTTVNVGEYYVIKKGTIGGNSATVNILNRFGELNENNVSGWTCSWEGKQEEDIARFPVKSVDSFEVKYTCTVDDNEYIQSFTVSPTQPSEGSYFKFEENPQDFIPSKIAISATNPNIYIPMPSVYNKNNEEIFNPTAETGNLGSVTLKVEDPSYKEITIQSNGRGKFISGTSLTKGVYVFTYTYSDEKGAIITSTTKQMEVLLESEYSNDYTLKYELSGAEIESAVTGVSRELPGAKGINQTTNEYVDVYYTVKAERLVNSSSVIWQDVSNEVFRAGTDDERKVIQDNKFTPNVNGIYKLTYVVKDFFGHEASLGSGKTFEVKDTESPTPIIWSATDNKETFVQAKFGNKNVIIPSITAKDNFTEAGNFKLRRRINRSNGVTVYDSYENADKDLVFNKGESFNISETMIEAKDSDGSAITLSEGSYTIYYYATDEANNERNFSQSFTISQEDYYEDGSAPVVGFKETFYSYYSKGDEISFTPTVSDNIDTTLRIKTSYKYSDEESFTVLTPEESDFKITKPFKLTIPANTTASTLIILAEATDARGNIGKKEIIITIRDNGDTSLLVLQKVNESDTVSEVKQGEEIFLPKLTYNDDKPEFVGISIYVTKLGTMEDHSDDINIDIKRAPIKKIKGEEITSEGASFDAIFAGEYVVKYVAKDGGGNIVVTFFTYTATPTVNVDEIRFSDSLPVELNGGNTLEFDGKPFKLPAAEVLLPETTKETKFRANINVIVTGSRNYDMQGFDFIAGAPGTYKIKYIAEIEIATSTDKKEIGAVDKAWSDFTSYRIDEEEENALVIESKEFTLEVKDTIAPVLTELYYPSIMNVMTSESAPFKILRMEASDISGIDSDKSTIVITSSRSGTTTIKDSETNELRYEYSFTRNDEYQITYTAYDIYGNNTSKTYTIKVGDTVSPVINLKENTIPETVKRGEELVIDLSKVTITDNKGFETIAEDSDVQKDPVSELLTITVRNKTTDKVIEAEEGTKNVFGIVDAGSYEVVFTVKDAAGWETSVTRTFEVATENNDPSISTEIIGTILIVVASLVFAGAIVYFIISSRDIDKKDRLPGVKEKKRSKTSSKDI